VRLALIAVAVAVLAACAGGASCDLREADDPPRCQERTGLQGTPLFSEFCDPVGGTGVNGGCPDADQIVGGCRQTSVGGEIIDWYYAPVTEDEVRATCGDEGTTFVDASEA
jgi:hypothetical protein